MSWRKWIAWDFFQPEFRSGHGLVGALIALVDVILDISSIIWYHQPEHYSWASAALGTGGSVLQWIHSSFSNRFQSVIMGKTGLAYGHPLVTYHGSILSAILFNTDMKLLREAIYVTMYTHTQAYCKACLAFKNQVTVFKNKFSPRRHENSLQLGNKFS